MARTTPGQDDRQIGRQDLGGYGGGRILCPVFDTDSTQRNFGFQPQDIPAGAEFDQLRSRAGTVAPPLLPGEGRDEGLIRVLNIPTLAFYSLETHYGLNIPYGEAGETAESRRRRLVDFQVQNWITLVQRALGADASNPKKVQDFLRVAVVSVRLASPNAVVNPREYLIDVQTTMNGQIVPSQSYGVPVPNPGRIAIKSNVRQRVQELRERTNALLDQRLRRG